MGDDGFGSIFLTCVNVGLGSDLLVEILNDIIITEDAECMATDKMRYPDDISQQQ